MTFNRREFLATGAAATAAIGTPMILKAQAKEYVLGASLPLTGPFATAGQLVAPAFSLAQKLFNDEGGIAGIPIRFVTEDSVEEKIVEKAARKLKVDNLIMQRGKFNSSNDNNKLGQDEMLQMIKHGY